MKISAIIYRSPIILLLFCALFGAGFTSSRAVGEEPFSIIALPDTQFYTTGHYGGSETFFYDQMNWIRDNKTIENIAMVVHEGDLVENRSDSEWAIADSAFHIIEHEVPYTLCVGNHELGPVGDWHAYTRETAFNDYFPPSRFQDNSLYQYGGNFDGSSTNYYLLFESGGMKFMIISIEFKPRDNVIAWANGVAAANQDRRCIVVTHGYLDGNGDLMTNYIDQFQIEGNNGPKIWETFLSLHKNIFLLLCGHAKGTHESHRSDAGLHGNIVHQVMANYQWWEYGGSGYLRIMKFFPDNNTIEVKTYSPSLDTYVDRSISRFTLEYEMERNFSVAVELSEQKPANFTLHGNYPNPFNPATTIEFNLPESSPVSLTIYNSSGQKIDELINRDMAQGEHSVTWDASRFTSGVYFYRLTANNQVEVRKILFLK